jgi:hypothetical protein
MEQNACQPGEHPEGEVANTPGFRVGIIPKAQDRDGEPEERMNPYWNTA